MANGPVKTYCQPVGIASDKRCDEITQDFNSVLRLCQLGLVSDATHWPKYSDLVKRYSGEGREIVIVVLNKIGNEMFRRIPWGNRVN